jgi:LEA14-like dessication related protein
MRFARFLALALIAVLAACAGRLVPEAARAPAEPVEPPVLQVDAFAPTGADAFGVTLAIQGRVTNPNPFEVEVVGYACKLWVDGRPAGSGHVDADLPLGPGGTGPVAVLARLHWADVPGFMAMLAARRSLTVHVDGTASVRAHGRSLEVPFSAQGPVALPLPPGVSLAGAAVRESNVLQTVVEVRLHVRNPNPFPLPVGRLAYDLSVGGVSVASAASQPLAGLAPGDAATVVIPVRVSAIGAVAGVLGGAARGRAEVALAGKAGYGPIEVGVDARARLGL